MYIGVKGIICITIKPWVALGFGENQKLGEGRCSPYNKFENR
jgi:hypothetical protein